MRVIATLALCFICSNILAQDEVKSDFSPKKADAVKTGGESQVSESKKAVQDTESEKKPESDDEQAITWLDYSADEYDKVRFEKPTIVLIMKDMCPGCAAARKKLWNSKTVMDAIDGRDFAFFSGNSAKSEGLQKEIEERFGASELPVTIICGKGMGDKPVLLYRFPKSEKLVEKIVEVIPGK